MFLSAILMACGNKTEGTEESSESSDSYVELVSSIIDDSNDFLVEYHTSLDNLYRNPSSTEQFKNVISDIIPKSSNIVNSLDDVLYSIDDALYDFHRNLIALVNFQHEMFLRSLEMANDESRDIDKDKLRADYLKVKNDQTLLVQEIKQVYANAPASD